MSLKTIDNFDENGTNFFALRFVFVKFESCYLRIFNFKIAQVYRNGHNFTTICDKIYAVFAKH